MLPGLRDTCHKEGNYEDDIPTGKFSSTGPTNALQKHSVA